LTHVLSLAAKLMMVLAGVIAQAYIEKSPET